MRVLPTAVNGVAIIEPRVFEDDRGFFMEVWHEERYRAAGIDQRFVQENHSHSVRGTIRGLHYQVERPQGKLIRVTSGAIYDVAVDLRRSSATFRQWVGIELSANNRRFLWIPRGCAHGFSVTSEVADVSYLCTDLYAPDLERTLRWDDPTIGITWPIEREPLLSAKDADGLPFNEAPLFG
ncbi:MAG: dTDP-4-dehydrorhamnose 3,5-epimerase [Gemmatimonadales bacterium]|nr:dTDP-4-dehydrorhamnose 3,5-epimerase [Gemmatimonadales bacterium]